MPGPVLGIGGGGVTNATPPRQAPEETDMEKDHSPYPKGGLDPPLTTDSPVPDTEQEQEKLCK